jgi:cytosine/adenosine deaminase-related metal-dependent hydrolase
MGMGFPAVFRATDKGCNACLGLDITSNQGNDFVAQMRLALQVQRAVDNQGGFPVAIKRKTAEVLRMGTLGGAEVLRVDHLVGSIAVGKKADLVIFRCDDISTVPVHDPTATVVFHTSSANIDTVIVNGRVVKKDGSLVGANWPSMRSALLSQSERIKAQAARLDLAAAKAKWLEVFSSPL